MSTHNIPFCNIKKKQFLNYPKSANMGFVPRDSRRAISVRAIEVLLYFGFKEKF